jgi:hypothetical protein
LWFENAMPLFTYPQSAAGRASADLFETGRYRVRDVGKHSGMTLCVRFDNRRIAVGGAEKTVKVYNRDPALSLFSEFGRSGGGHTGNVRWIQFDTEKLLSGSADHTTYEELERLPFSCFVDSNDSLFFLFFVFVVWCGTGTEAW